MIFKKIAAVLIALFIAVPAGITASAQTRDTNGYEEKLRFLSELGIVKEDEVMPWDDEIPKELFTAFTVRAVNVTAFSKESAFSDVPKDSPYCAEISAAYNMGIVSGNGHGIFGAGSVNEAAALKMLLNALGYEPLAEARGGYPTGYALVSNVLRLGRGARENVNVKFDGAVSLIFDMLFVQSYEPEKVGEAEISYKKSDCLLYRNFGLRCATGRIMTAGVRSARSDFRLDDNTIEIGSARFKLKKGADYGKYLGYSAEGWYDPETETLCALFIKDTNKTVELDISDAISFSGDAFTVYDGNGRETKYKLSSGFVFVNNGRLSNPDIDFEKASGTVKLIDSDNDGLYDFVTAETYKYIILQSADPFGGELTDVNSHIYGNGAAVVLSDSGENFYEITLITENGETKAEIADIKKGMTGLVYMSDDGTYTRVKIQSKMLFGTVDETRDDEIVIDGIPYGLNSYFKSYYTVTPGMECNFYIAPDNTVTGFERPASSDMAYGFLSGIKLEKSTFNATQVRIVTASGKSQTFSVSQKLRLDGMKVSDVYTAMKERFTKADDDGSVYPAYQLIKYKANENNEITDIDIAEEKSVSCDGNSVTMPDAFCGDDVNNNLTCYFKDKKVWWSSGIKNISPYGTVENAVVFHVPVSLRTEPYQIIDEYGFSVGSITWENNVKDKYASGYDYRDDMTLGAVVVYDVEYSGGKGAEPLNVGESSSYIVEAVTVAITDSGEIAKKLLLYDGIKFVSGFVSPMLEAKLTIPKPGDIIRIAYGSDGYIGGISVDVEYDAEKKKGIVNSSASIYSVVSFVAGKIYYKNGNNYVIYPDVPMSMEGFVDDTLNGLRFCTSDSGVKILCYDSQSKGARPATAEEIKLIRYAGLDGASNVVVRFRYEGLNTVIIYK